MLKIVRKFILYLNPYVWIRSGDGESIHDYFYKRGQERLYFILGYVVSILFHLIILSLYFKRSFITVDLEPVSYAIEVIELPEIPEVEIEEPLPEPERVPIVAAPEPVELQADNLEMDRSEEIDIGDLSADEPEGRGEIAETSLDIAGTLADNNRFEDTKIDFSDTSTPTRRGSSLDSKALSLSRAEGGTSRRGTEKVKIDLETKQGTKNNKANSQSQLSTNITNVTKVVLRSSESSLGTEEYKLWTDIEFNLDRINRSDGNLPSNVKRIRGELTVSIVYSDRARHDIYWRSGRAWIEIFSSANGGRLNGLGELKRARSALRGLTSRLSRS